LIKQADLQEILENLAKHFMVTPINHQLSPLFTPICFH